MLINETKALARNNTIESKTLCYGNDESKWPSTGIMLCPNDSTVLGYKIIDSNSLFKMNFTLKICPSVVLIDGNRNIEYTQYEYKNIIPPIKVNEYLADRKLVFTNQINKIAIQFSNNVLVSFNINGLPYYIEPVQVQQL